MDILFAIQINTNSIYVNDSSWQTARITGESPTMLASASRALWRCIIVIITIIINPQITPCFITRMTQANLNSDSDWFAEFI